jgi:hypothetical protein
MTERWIIIHISKKLLPVFVSNKHHKEVSYIYLLGWVKKMVEKHKHSVNIKQMEQYITHLFYHSLRSLFKEYLDNKPQYITIRSSIYSATFAHKLFKNIEEATEAHVLNSYAQTISLSEWKNKFSYRIATHKAEEAYPPHERPREGNRDLESVKYHQSLLKQGKLLQPIYLINKTKKPDKSFQLLDGYHRLVAYQIEKHNNIPAVIIYI